MKKTQKKITALVLAAGQSKRMGQPKMLLPWGGTTVLGQVLATLRAAGLEEILVVSGAEREAVEKIAKNFGARTVHNADFSNGEMLSSLQRGLEGIAPEVAAALVCLGDQPQARERTVRGVLSRFLEGESALVVASHRLRRGHPWLAARPLWDEVLSLRAPASPRDFLNAHAQEIEYFDAQSETIFADVDTPDEYRNAKPAEE